MRTLVFNLLVVGALAFLLFDGDPPASVRGAVDKVAVNADRLVEQGKALVGKPAAEPQVRRTPPVSRPPGPMATTAVDDSGDESVVATPPPAPAASVADAPRPAISSPRSANSRKATDAPARALDPDVARRRAEVLGEVPDSAANAPAATTGFMTPRVRRGELHNLAEDMELMFVEKAGR